ncbi:MAG: hypothetical protein J7507_06645 [Pseudoxanthomonas sp.]|nr:hypothetical protein [Pseudoxanthomonas sp.]
MQDYRTFAVPSRLVFGAAGIALLASAGLSAFPDNVRVWQVEAWLLVAALATLLVLVPASLWSLAVNRAARTWPRYASVSLGTAILVVVGIGSL